MPIILLILSDQPIPNVAFIKDKSRIGDKHIFLTSERTVAGGIIDNIKSACKILDLNIITIDADRSPLIQGSSVIT